MSYIEVFTPRYTQTKGWPDLEACVSALPLCWQTGADEIRVVMEGESHPRTYTVAEVEERLVRQPELSAYQGLGNVDVEHGYNLAPGRHIACDRRRPGIQLPEQ